MPTGRGIAGLFKGIKILNLYTPSGSEKRNEREKFYDLDIPRLLHHPESKLIIAGDFTCVLKNTSSHICRSQIYYM
jgi:exonuclease III